MYFCFAFSFFCTLFSQVKSVCLRGECVRVRSLSQSAPAPVSVSMWESARVSGNLRESHPQHPEGRSIGFLPPQWKVFKAWRGEASEFMWKKEWLAGCGGSNSFSSLSAQSLCVSKFCSEEGSLAACVKKYVQTTLVHLSLQTPSTYIYPP